jgi:long-chain fatty acid transport protein
VAIAWATPAWAGGIDEVPDQGAQALGRGAAFVAKADDPTALYYNVAGLARQRGTKLLASANVSHSSLSFARSGSYPDNPQDPATPWGGHRFPKVENAGGPSVLPLLFATSDFGTERFTAGVGIFGPSVSGRTYPLGLKGAPSPARYDSVHSDTLIMLPTAGAAYSIAPWLDLGVSAHLVMASYDEISIAYADATPGMCKNAEYQPCDARGHFGGRATSFAASLGVLLKPSDAIEIGAQLRSPTKLEATGEVASDTPKALGSGALPPAQGTLTMGLPAVLRVGTRYVRREAGVEVWDVEVDGIYERWGSAQDPSLTGKGIGIGGTGATTIPVVHKWHDTFGVRVGGAYEIPFESGVMALRAGAYYDSSASDSAYTRLDFDTLPKIAGTLGFGYRRGAFAANLAYAGVGDLTRVVTDGDVRPPNAAAGGAPIDSSNKPLPAVNNGTYSGFTHVLAMSVSVDFETLILGPRQTSNSDFSSISRTRHKKPLAATPSTIR